VQQGPKLLATGGANAELGYSVALSADGNTAIAGGPFDASLTGGAAWVFTRANGVWSQQGNKLVPSDVSGSHTQVGCSVALSADGNTALIGGRFDSNGAGAAWVFTRTNGVWSQQGAKLVGAGASSGSANQGSSVALSADGNTALLGGPEDGTATFAGAAWVFTRSNGVWSQQGPKLVGTGAIDGAIGAGQGFSVALSADGNTAVVGGPSDSPGQDEHCNYGGVQIDHVAAVGAAWVFTRTNGSWSQQGSKLVGTGAVAGVAHQGTAVALSADGNLALLGGPDDAQPGGDCEGTGANWVFTRRNGLWSQEGNKLVGSGSVNGPFGGSAQDVLGLSADGSTALIGGPSDNSFVGAVWVFTQPATTHFAVSAPTSAAAGAAFNFTVTAQDAGNNTFAGYSGTVHFTSTDSAAQLPADATLVNGTGGFPATLPTAGNQTITAADTAVATITGTSSTIAVNPAATHFTVSAPASATAGTTFNFTVAALDSSNHTVPTYSGTVHFSSTDSAAALPANATLTNGTATFAATLNTAASQTITATDTAAASITGTSAAIVVTTTAAVPPSPVSVTPPGGNAPNPTYTFIYSDPRGYLDLNVVDILVNNFLDGRHACYLAYIVGSSTLILVDDGGDAGGPYAGNVKLGNSAAIQNSQCAATLVSATGSGNTLTLVLTIAWTNSFAGDKIVYMSAGDVSSNNSGWYPLGVARAPGGTPTTTTAVVSMTPNRGTGLGPTQFTFNWSDTKGFADLGVENILIDNFLDGRHACYLAFSRPSNTLFLVDDAGDGGGPFAGSASLAAAGTIQNSQCTVSWGATAVNTTGNNLSLTLNIAFTAAFAGNRVIYMAARDLNDANNTDWHAMGTWTPQ